MMDDWIDILKNRLENESLPLPENDWAWFEAKFRQRRRRKILAGWSAAGLGIAAAVALIVMLPTRKTDEETSLVSKGPVVAVVDEPIELQETVSERLGAVGERSRTTAQVPGREKKPSVITPTSNPEPDPAAESVPSEESEHVEDAETPVRRSFDSAQEPDNNAKEPGNDAQEPVRRRITISPYAGGISRKTNSNQTDIQHYLNMPHTFASYGDALSLGIAGNNKSTLDAFHAIPISFGLEVNFPLSEKLSLTSGADLTLFRSKISYMNISFPQNAYYLGVPLRLDWTLWESGPVSVWVGTGGKVDRLICGKNGDRTLKDNTFHWSATGVAGIDYELIRGLSLFFQPGISYYFKPASPAILTYRTEHPLMISLDAGFRINL